MIVKEARKIAETVLAGGLGDGNRAYTEADLTAAYRKLCHTFLAADVSLADRMEQHLEARGVETVKNSARFYIISATLGLIGTAETQEDADHRALVAAVNTGRTVHLHDRLTEGG